MYCTIYTNTENTVPKEVIMININMQSKFPIYEQLYNHIVKMVSMDIMLPNQKLPTVRSLARELSINPNTVQKAYQLLERDNIIYSVSGKGSYISEKSNAENKKNIIAVIKINDVLKELNSIGITKSDVISIVEKYFENEKLKQLNKEEKNVN